MATNEIIVKMLFQAMVCMLLCRAGLSLAPIEETYQFGNVHQLQSSEEEISPVHDELSFAPENENHPYENTLISLHDSGHNRLKRGIRLRSSAKGGSRPSGGGSRPSGGGSRPGGGYSSSPPRYNTPSYQTRSTSSYPRYPSSSRSSTYIPSSSIRSSSSSPNYHFGTSTTPPLSPSSVKPNDIGWLATQSPSIRPSASSGMRLSSTPPLSGSIKPSRSSSINHQPTTTIINNHYYPPNNQYPNNYNQYPNNYNYYPNNNNYYPGGYYSNNNYYPLPIMMPSPGGYGYGHYGTSRRPYANSEMIFEPNIEKNGFVYSKEGKDFDVTCEGPFRSLVWLYNNNEVSTNKKNDVYQKDPDSHQYGMKRKLKIEDAKKRYEGRYVCVGISSKDGIRVERAFTLSIKDDSFFKSSGTSSGGSGIGSFVSGLALGTAGGAFAGYLTGNALGGNKNPDDPELSINGDEILGSNVYAKVNESLEVDCKGDTEDITWKSPHSGLPIRENSTLRNPAKVERLKPKKVALKIQSVAVTDEGEYICEVTRPMLKRNQKSFKLNVIEPVRIIDFPEKSTSLEGDKVKLSCVTSGRPKAIVNWRFNKKLSDGSTHPILLVEESNSRYKFEGDTLVIKNVTHQDEGRYMCEARQDIIKGTTDMKTVDLFVQHKPHASQNFTIVEKAFNFSSEIPCKITANPAANYTWYRKIDDVYQNVSLPSVDPVLKINITSLTQYGEYKCTANNSLGYGEQYILLNQMALPQSPTVEVDNDTSTPFVEYFRIISSQNISFTHYIVEYSKENDTNWINVTIPIGETWDHKYNVSNLMENTTYTLRVRSVNDLGKSDPSSVVTFTTMELPKPPKVIISKVTDSSIHFKVITENNRTITYFNVEIKHKHTNDWRDVNITRGPSWDTEYQWINLTQGTTYNLRASSANMFAMSQPSNEEEFTTLSRQASLHTSFGIRLTASYSVSFLVLAFAIARSTSILF